MPEAASAGVRPWNRVTRGEGSCMYVALTSICKCPLHLRLSFSHDHAPSNVIHHTFPLAAAKMVNMNVFRILGDVSHTASKCILIWAIHNNKSAEGVSLLTQWLYMLVFCARYLDLFWVPPQFSWWNTLLKLFYISSSVYIVYIMMRVYARTREKEYAWKLATWSLGASLVSAPLVCLIFEGVSGISLFEASSSSDSCRAQQADWCIDCRLSGPSASSSKASVSCHSSSSSAKPPCPPSSTASTSSH